MSLAQPVPALSSTRSGSTLASGATPTTPKVFCPSATIVPDDVGAVALAVLRDGVVVDEVPAVDVVDEAVVVVVDPERAAGLAGIGGDLVGQVDVRGGDPGVDHGDGHTRALALVPRADGVDVVARRAELAADHLAGVLQRPERAERGVVERPGDVHQAVRLGVDDVVVGAQRGERPGGIVGADELGAIDRERLDEVDAGIGAQFARSPASRPGTRWTMMSPSAACAAAGKARTSAAAAMTSERIT